MFGDNSYIVWLHLGAVNFSAVFLEAMVLGLGFIWAGKSFVLT